jgi:Zn-finger nucleic acid-binding protein
MTKHRDKCPDCGAAIGEPHLPGCDIEPCPHCGGQALSCAEFDYHDPRRMPWSGEWPWATEAAAASEPDLNRFHSERRWNADRQRWEPKTSH